MAEMLKVLRFAKKVVGVEDHHQTQAMQSKSQVVRKMRGRVIPVECREV